MRCNERHRDGWHDARTAEVVDSSMEVGARGLQTLTMKVSEEVEMQHQRREQQKRCYIETRHRQEEDGSVD